MTRSTRISTHSSAALTIAASILLCLCVAEPPGLSLLASASGQAPAKSETTVEDWIKANAIPLQTVQAGNGSADMEPLAKIVGNARIVELGEATHGTREFFQLKHRMLEFLATRMGFTIFSIEANMPEAYRLNDYVLYGKGDPAELLKGMYFWTWDTKEVLDMIVWMREFNRSGKGRVEFTGFDMQTPTVAAQNVSDFVSKNDPAYLSTLKTAMPIVDDAAAKVQWRLIIEHLGSSRAKYLEGNVSSREVDWAIQNARVVLQSLQMKSGEVTRDRAMADNVKWILDQSPGAKMVIWAHNGHVGTTNGAMGAELRHWYGEQMVVFGFAFDQGSFQAVEKSRGLRKFTVAAAPPESLDGILAASGVPIFALDVRDAPTAGPVGKWMKEAHKSRSIGAVYSEEDAAIYFIDLYPRATYDAILFVRRTTAAVANHPVESAVACSGTGRAVCTDMRYDVSFRLPERWDVKVSTRWGDHENTVVFDDPRKVAGQSGPSLYYKALNAARVETPEAVQEELQKEMESKVEQRRSRQHLATYALRAETCGPRTVGGHPARSCIAEFTNESGTAMTEYLTLVKSENTLALFFGYVPANALETYRQGCDAIIETLQIP